MRTKSKYHFCTPFQIDFYTHFLYNIVRIRNTKQDRTEGGDVMTTSEIARLLGISRGTVSRVLNNHPNVKEDTRQRVLAALEEYQYSPNEVARSLVMKQNFKIAVIAFSDPEFFWAQVRQGVSIAQEELKAYGVTVDFFSTDILVPQEQCRLIHDLPEQGYQALAVATNIPQLLIDEIDRLSSSGFPVVLFNVDIPTVNRLCYIGCDYLQAGVLAAELMAKSIAGSGKIAILTLKDQVLPIEQRITGFRNEISKSRNLSISQISRFNRKGDGVYEEVCSILQNTPDLSGIFVSFGALEQTAHAIRTCQKTGQIVLVGYDLSEAIYELIQERLITAVLCNEPFRQGYLAVKILYNYLSKGARPPQSSIYCKLEAVFASNAKYYLDENQNAELFQL